MENELTPSQPDIDVSQAQAQAPAAAPTMDKQALKKFYQQDLMGIVKKIFLEPFNGSYQLFVNRSEKSYFHAIILIASAAILGMILTYFTIPGQFREYAPWFSIMVKAGIAVIVTLLLISAFSFGIKMLSGKPSFRNELLTGGLCAIPLTALMLLIFLSSKLIIDEDALSSIAFGGIEAMIQKAGFVLIIVFYILLLFINILQQSLRAAGTKDILLFYLPPICIVLSFYITMKIMS